MAAHGSDTAAHSFCLGTGAAVMGHLTDRILELIEKEVIIVTCFWAPSSSQQHIADLLQELSNRAVRSGSNYCVRLCFSSLSLLQKLTHTWSQDGFVYPSKLHASKLRLPSTLPGLDLQVKSVFLLPFSVMHPKYVLIDRKTALLPSCNVSWEEWFEGSLEFSGAAVTDLFTCWREFWARPNFSVPPTLPTRESATTSTTTRARVAHVGLYDHAHLAVPSTLVRILPSAHHRNPAFQPLPFLKCPAPPRTQLNTFTLDILHQAKEFVLITTPNITSPPFLEAIQDCLRRGVDIRIITNDKLMTLEQLLTAGSTTPRCVAWLAKRYARMLTRHENRMDDIEHRAGIKPLGSLHIDYFRPLSKARGEAVKLHLKLMVVDHKVVVLGSGNQDRASWFTSQELGVAVMNDSAASAIKTLVEKRLAERYEHAIALGSSNASAQNSA